MKPVGLVLSRVKPEHVLRAGLAKIRLLQTVVSWVLFLADLNEYASSLTTTVQWRLDYRQAPAMRCF
jgi:hypothetical protein